MVAYARVESYAFDDCLRVEAFYLGVCVELVEVAHPQGEVGVGEEFHGFGLLEPHVQSRDVGLYCPLLQQGRECVCGLFEACDVGNGCDCGVFGCEFGSVDCFRHAGDYP